jgi:phosphoribosyl-ATP pyrophosphohydrolase
MKLEELYGIICERRDNPSERSYTTQLMQKGEDEILKKIGEEAVEVVLAGKGQGDERLVEEVADLAYHTLVLLSQRRIPPEAIEQELERRHRKKTDGKG